MKDYYKVLGVQPEAPQEAIRAAYRRLARKYHPDRNKAHDAEERFKEVGEAWEVLKDAQRRAAYDRIRAGGPIPGFGGGGFEGQGFGGVGNGATGGPEIDLGALFEQLFGGFGGRSGARPGAGSRPRARAERGEDVSASLTIDLPTAYRGGSERVLANGRSLAVTLPAGVTDGQKLRLKGQGEPGPGGAGDLILTVKVRPHPEFRVAGRNLHRRLDIPPWIAAFGGAVTVETLSGRLELTVPVGARSGQKLRVRGRGLPGSPAGDLLVELMIQLPAADSQEVAELYRRLQAHGA